MDIHIFWEGPYLISQLKGLIDDNRDYGIYQVYGQHPLYGNSILLYIGKANEQTFGKRIGQEEWLYETDPQNIQIYVGRIAGHKSVSESEWGQIIDLAETLTIYAHQPVYNTSNTSSIPEKSVLLLHIFNWDSYRDLFPEISGKRHTSKYDHIGEDKIYTSDSLKA